MTQRSAALSKVLAAISQSDALRAQRARRGVEVGIGATLALLVTAFLFFYFRSAAPERSWSASPGKRNCCWRESPGGAHRRADRPRQPPRARRRPSPRPREPSDQAELLLAILDLDGFKQYNDTFGHAAGDALLQRLGVRLGSWSHPRGLSPTGIGGDEFCMFARVRAADAEALLAA